MNVLDKEMLKAISGGVEMVMPNEPLPIRGMTECVYTIIRKMLCEAKGTCHPRWWWRYGDV